MTVDLGFKVFVLSAGVLPYPLTFLVTDVLSEVYGRRRAQQVVHAGFIASAFTVVVVMLGWLAPAIPDSPVDDATYTHVFAKTPLLIAASMVAYLAAQHVDVHLFHFWKRLTEGRHLWLRNNASTIVSQLVDTVLVVSLIFYDRLLDGDIDYVAGLVLEGWLFKVLCALLDTPLIYGAVAVLGSHPHDEG